MNAQKVLRLLQRGEFAAAARLRLSPELAIEIERALRAYVRYTLEQSPRSLEFVDAVRHAEDRSGPAALPRVAEAGEPAYAAASRQT